MSAAGPGGIKKPELYISTPAAVPIRRRAVVQGNPIECYFRPVSPLIKVVSYVVLWRDPAIST